MAHRFRDRLAQPFVLQSRSRPKRLVSGRVRRLLAGCFLALLLLFGLSRVFFVAGTEFRVRRVPVYYGLILCDPVLDAKVRNGDAIYGGCVWSGFSPRYVYRVDLPLRRW